MIISVDEDFSSWTSCEFYGHKFVDGSCIDCHVEEDSSGDS